MRAVLLPTRRRFYWTGPKTVADVEETGDTLEENAL